MAVLKINRITGATNNLVYMQTSDTTAIATAANYLTAQAANILAITEGGWTWESNDLIILSASDGVSLATINSTFTSLTSIASGANPFAVQSVAFTLTSAQWLAMFTTPVLIIPAQGLGTIIVPGAIEFELIYGSVAYSGGGPVGFEYGNAGALAGPVATNVEQAADFFATANTIYKFNANNGNNSQITKAAGNNAGIYISNTTAVFAAGNSTFSGNASFRVYPIV
jgi:hypothetical protein